METSKTKRAIALKLHHRTSHTTNIHIEAIVFVLGCVAKFNVVVHHPVAAEIFRVPPPFRWRVAKFKHACPAVNSLLTALISGITFLCLKRRAVGAALLNVTMVYRCVTCNPCITACQEQPYLLSLMSRWSIDVLLATHATFPSITLNRHNGPETSTASSSSSVHDVHNAIYFACLIMARTIILLAH